MAQRTSKAAVVVWSAFAEPSPGIPEASVSDILFNILSGAPLRQLSAIQTQAPRGERCIATGVSELTVARKISGTNKRK